MTLAVIVAVAVAIVVAAVIALTGRSVPVEPAPAPSTPPAAPADAAAPAADQPALLVPGAVDEADDARNGRSFASIDQAARAAQPGDTLLIRGGTYRRERITIDRSGAPGRPITIKPFPGQRVVIDGETDTVTGSDRWFSNAGLVTVGADHVVVEGLEIRNSATHALHVTGDHVVVRRNVLHHAWLNGLEMHASHALVEDNEIYSTAMSNYRNREASWAGGLNVGTRDQDMMARDVTVRRNFVHEIWGEALAVGRTIDFRVQDNTIRNSHSVHMIVDGSRSGVVESNYVHTTRDWRTNRAARAFVWGTETHWTFNGPAPLVDVTFRNNVFANVNDAAYLRMDPASTYSGVRIIGNTFLGSGVTADGVIVGAATGNVFKNNIVGRPVRLEGEWDVSHNAFPADAATGGEAFVVDPEFRDADGRTVAGLELRPTSRLRDAGIALPDLSRDYSGQDRGDAPTIGAHEVD